MPWAASACPHIRVVEEGIQHDDLGGRQIVAGGEHELAVQPGLAGDRLLVQADAALGDLEVTSGIARDAAAFIANVSDFWILQILAVDVLIILLGTVLDVLPAMVVPAPVLVPAMVQLGFDPLHFAIVMILTLNVANITPPVGMTLMTAAKIADVPYERAIRQSAPFFASHMVVIVLVSLVPEIALWLPTLIR